MILNSSRLMPALCSRYCGMVLYLSNSACHARASSGGTTPVTGFHSTIERPDSVSRVAPPTITVTNMRAATASSQNLTARRPAAEGARLIMRSFDCRRRGANHIVVHALPQLSKHAPPPAQVPRRDHADRPRGDVGAAGDGAGAIAPDQGQRGSRSALLCHRRSRLGVACHAAHSLDVAELTKRASREPRGISPRYGGRL